MKKNIGIVLTAVSLFLMSFTELPSPVAESIVVIVHKDNPVASLSAGEVKLYYLRKIKKRWPEINKNIRPADRKNKCAEQEAFYSQVLHMTGTEVEQYFVNKQLQNAERPQDKFQSDADIINFVADEPGAIGYINARSASAEVKSRVKVVLSL